MKLLLMIRYVFREGVYIKIKWMSHRIELDRASCRVVEANDSTAQATLDHRIAKNSMIGKRSGYI